MEKGTHDSGKIAFSQWGTLVASMENLESTKLHGPASWSKRNILIRPPPKSIRELQNTIIKHARNPTILKSFPCIKAVEKHPGIS